MFQPTRVTSGLHAAVQQCWHLIRLWTTVQKTCSDTRPAVWPQPQTQRVGVTWGHICVCSPFMLSIFLSPLSLSHRCPIAASWPWCQSRRPHTTSPTLPAYRALPSADTVSWSTWLLSSYPRWWHWCNYVDYKMLSVNNYEWNCMSLLKDNQLLIHCEHVGVVAAAVQLHHNDLLYELYCQ